MGIGLKLLFAALSGALVMLTWIMFFETDGWVGEVAFYGSCGALFAAGVLLPYVKSGHLRSWRTVAVFVVSGISFYAAVTAAIEWGSGRFGPNLEDYLVASLVGTAIVLLPAPYLLSLRYSLRFAVLGVIAALLGGWLFEVFEEWFAYSMFLSFALWHVVMCGALHWANPSAADDRWLANVGRRKLYGVASLFSLFIIVPLVDDAIGASLQYRYTANEGGIQVHEPVTAHGFRDRREEPVLFDTGCSFGCITLVNDRTYDFQEYVDDHPDHRFLLFFIARRMPFFISWWAYTFPLAALRPLVDGGSEVGCRPVPVLQDSG